MRIAVIGGSGFIGSNLTTKLKSSGHDVVSLDISDGSLDVTDHEETNNTLKRLDPEIVYYLAAKMRVSDFQPDPVPGCDINVMGLANVLTACTQIKSFKKIIFSSTIHVYACCDSESKVHEDTVLDYNRTVHPYAWTKLAGEALIRSYNQTFNLPYIILRFGVVYGPGGHKDMVLHRYIDNCIKGLPIECYGSGDTKRTFVYIDDVITGLESSATSDVCNDTINLCNSESVSIIDLYKYITETVRHTDIIHKPDRLGDFSSPVISNYKASHTLNWRPNKLMIDGIKLYQKSLD